MVVFTFQYIKLLGQSSGVPEHNINSKFLGTGISLLVLKRSDDGI
jgi:hypothetical protein